MNHSMMRVFTPGTPDSAPLHAGFVVQTMNSAGAHPVQIMRNGHGYFAVSKELWVGYFNSESSALDMAEIALNTVRMTGRTIHARGPKK